MIKSKIAILTPQSLPVVGGLQVVVDALAGGLISSGHRVRLFTPTPPADNLPYPVVHMKNLYPFYPVPPQNMPGLERGIEEFLENEYNREPFDILHAHLTYPTGFCALNWGKRRGVRVIITCHGIDVIGIKNEHYGFLVHDHLREKISRCLSTAPALTIISPHLKEHLLSLGAAADTIHTIPNGVCADDFKNSGEISEPPYILAMGCLHRIKGFDILLDALAMAREKVPDIALKIAGEGPDRAELIEKSLRKNLSGNVVFLPFVRGEEKISCFTGCRFVVCPSRYESFGMVILEAMAAGKPVVGFDVGGVGGLIRHRENGLLVAPGDVEGLCEGMLKLWNREISFSESRLREAARTYDWKSVTKQYISLYRSL